MRNNKLIKENYQYGWRDEVKSVNKPRMGLSRSVVEEISAMKKEPVWMRDFRLKALEIFQKKEMPNFGPSLCGINFDEIYYYLKPTEKKARSWEDVPENIRNTYEKLGVPMAERRYLSGVEAQFDSEMIYGRVKKEIEKKGVIFCDMDTALREYPDLVKQYLGTIIKPNDNKFAALNSCVWSGGSFIYVPKGVRVDFPLQTYFRINADKMGQFERTIIIADEGSFVHYVEGCSSPVYSEDSLHAAVVEIIVKKGARVRYTTIQNWSNNVYNLVTKRAFVSEEGTMEWVDCNLGCLSKKARLFVDGDGYKHINEIIPGDYVYSLDFDSMLPCKKKVLAATKTGIKKIFKLVTENYREIEATENHPFLTLTRDNMSKQVYLLWKSLKDLKKGDFVALVRGIPDEGKPLKINFVEKRKGLKNIIKIPDITSDSLMWLFGLYFGDGYMEKTKKGTFNRMYFAVPVGDRAYARLIKELEDLFGCEIKKKGICVTVGSVMMVNFFISLGILGSARTKRIPRWVFNLPVSQKLSFVKGYFDSDGYLRKELHKDCKTYGQMVFTSVNKDLLGDLKLLMISCGLNPLKISTYVKERRLALGKVKKEYSSNYLSLNIKDCFENIEKGIADKPRIDFARIRSIEELGEEEVFDIEIQDSHNFIADGLVVHNSKITMKYPACVLAGRKAKGSVLSMAFAGKGQIIDSGGKMIHIAPQTSGTIITKSISKDGGSASYRGSVLIQKGAKGTKSKVKCDALILDEKSSANTYPHIKIMENDVEATHEAVTGKLNEDQVFYLQSRGIKQEDAEALLINGFIEPMVRELPIEYAVELNRLIKLEMEGSVG